MNKILWGDTLSNQIFEELTLLNRTGDLKHLINAHKLQGIETDPLIKLHVEVLRSVREEKREVILWGLGEHIVNIRDAEKKLYNAIGYANWPFLCDLPISYCCDKKISEGEFVLGNRSIPIISMDKLEEIDNAIYLIGTTDYYNEVKKELIDKGVSEKDIYLYIYGGAKVTDEKQYIDEFMIPMKEHTIIDAGAYDGNTIWRLINWNEGCGYDKIIGLEPDYTNYLLCCENCKSNRKIQIYNCGIGNKVEKLGFEMKANSGAFFSEDSLNRVCVNTIDRLCKDEKVSYIKMDIEGYELKALEGAWKTIKKNHPRLAICVYHKKEDLEDVVTYISQIDSSYKYYIRTYSNIYMETVLYAI